MRSSFGRASAALVSFCLLLSACGSDKVDHAALVTALTTNGATTEQAECVADKIYAEGAFTEDELKDAAADITKTEDFQEAVDEAFASCGIS